MQLIRKSGSLVKLNLRLAPEKLKAAGALCQNRGGHCRRNTWMAEAIAERLVQPEASSPPFASRNQANLPPISCTRIKQLLVRLIRGKSCQRPQQVGQDFLRGVLARDNQSGNGGARDA
jgi:hypothetical protein